MSWTVPGAVRSVLTVLHDANEKPRDVVVSEKIGRLLSGFGFGISNRCVVEVPV